MKKLKKISNYLLMIGGILTALSGITNTALDIIGSFKKEDKKEVAVVASVAPAPVVFEQRVHGTPGVRISKTVDMPAPAPAPAANEVSGKPTEQPVEQPVAATMSPQSLNETKNTLWWVIATLAGSFIAMISWYIHGKLSVSIDVSKKDDDK